MKINFENPCRFSRISLSRLERRFKIQLSTAFREHVYRDDAEIDGFKRKIVFSLIVFSFHLLMFWSFLKSFSITNE